MDNVLLVCAIVNIPSNNQGKSNPHVKNSKTFCMLLLDPYWGADNLQVVIFWEDYLGMTLKSLKIRSCGFSAKPPCVFFSPSYIYKRS